MSTAKFDTLQNVAGTKSVPVSTVVDGSAKAWVNFNGTGTVAIRASFNVSSITDNGTGDYTVNFTNAMTDATYGAAALLNGGSGGSVMAPYTTTAPTTSAYRLGTRRTDTFAALDTEYANVAIFR
jgi:hypothetical protein